MKKYLFIILIIAGLGYFPSTALAKVWLLDTSQSQILTLDNGLVVEMLEWDKSSVKLGVELQTLADGTQKFGIYPSTKAVKYRLQLLTGPMLNYTSDTKLNNWQSLDQVITDNKIILKETDVLVEVEENTQLTEESSTADEVITVFSVNPVTVTKAMGPVKNKDLKLISSIYKLSGAQSGDNIEFKYTNEDNYSKSIYYYDTSLLQWIILDSYNDFPVKTISTKIIDPNVMLAIFADLTAEDGIASFYDQSRYRYFNYQNGNFAASRDYPKGTKLKVTRLKTNESVIVEVNDYGPELGTGRVIDLDISAFKQIGSTRAGLIYVKVEPYDQNS